MWVVLKYKNKELKLLKNDAISKIGKNVEFYAPKIKKNKFKNNKLIKIEEFILGDYIFCYHEKLQDSNFLNIIKNLKGLKYILNYCSHSQKEINNFIFKCQKNENNGYLTQSFFENNSKKKGQFVSGPFTNLIFEIVENQKNKLKIISNNITTIVSKKSEYLYRYI